MSTMTRRDVDHVCEQLRKGLVPERGIDTFAVGIEKHRQEIHRQLDLAIMEMEMLVYCNQLELRRLKKRKLQLKDAISRLESMMIPNLDA